jgi:hypothetical protein
LLKELKEKAKRGIDRKAKRGHDHLFLSFPFSLFEAIRDSLEKKI